MRKSSFLAWVFCLAWLASCQAPGESAIEGRAAFGTPVPFPRVSDDALSKRVAALAALGSQGSLPAARKAAVSLSAQEVPEVQLAALDAITCFSAEAATPLCLERWNGLTPFMRAEVVERLLATEDSSLALLERVEAGERPLSDWPAQMLYRLRNHEVDRVAERARRSLDRLGGETLRRRDAYVRYYGVKVCNGDGDSDNGRVVFERTCSPCHTYEGKGTGIGPDLTAVGLLGSEVVLRHMLDPNRSVGIEHVAYTAVTRSGEVFSGAVTSETPRHIVLRNAGSTRAVARSELLSLESQGVSLMPEGLETTMDSTELRDLMTFLEERSSYRALDFGLAANMGRFSSLQDPDPGPRESKTSSRYERVDINGVPYRLLSSATTPRQRHAIALGGSLSSEESRATGAYPRRAEIPCGFPARALHFLGGLAPWTAPERGDDHHVMTVTLRYASGSVQEVAWSSALELEGGFGVAESSTANPVGVSSRSHNRLLSIVPERHEPIVSLELRSAESPIMPVIVAVTAELLADNN